MDIEYIEKRVRQNGAVIQKQLNESTDMDCEANDQSLMDIFGPIHAANPRSFYFERGEYKLIEELVSHVKKVVVANGINSGLKRFQYKAKGKKTKCTRAQNVPELKINPVEPDNQKQLAENNDRYLRLKADLFRLVSTRMQKLNFSEYLEEDMVDVRIDSETDRCYGSIMCAVCKAKKVKNPKPHSVSYYSRDDRNYWVMENFNKHLTEVHKLTAAKKNRW